MVRVISVHNFAKQDITAVDESIGVAAVPPDIILLAQPNNTILVRDLTQLNDAGYVIPTIDQVYKLVYSIQGNYIATLENKLTRSGTKVSYTRVYINWELLKDCKDSFPMRARIAGRVTPLSQNQKGLEMVEIPNQYMPDLISCCPLSGNLLVSSQNILNIYIFEIETHDISKIYFINFKQLSVDLHLSFTPSRHQIVEDMIAVQNDEYLHVFKIKSAVPLCSLSDNEFSVEDIEREKNYSKIQLTKKKANTINYEKLIKEVEELRNPLDYINDQKQRINLENHDFVESELSKISKSSFPVKHEFPTITFEKSFSVSSGLDMFRQNPFTIAKDLTVNFALNSKSSSNNTLQYKAINICRYHLFPLTISSGSNQKVLEKFTFLILKPYYEYGKCEGNNRKCVLESEHFGNLKSIACFFGTQHEGYLHSFEYGLLDNEEPATYGNYVSYTFTAPVLEVQLDDCFLHAITEVGLETYTLRAAKHLLKTSDTEICPSSNDPICLIGLHPFVNVFQTCITYNYLTLFANNEESSFTLYQLESPDPISIWKDFFAYAEENKWEAPATYCEMLGEGHLILKTKLKTVRWFSKKDSCKNQISFAATVTPPEKFEQIKTLYQESCALLADYHILNKNYQTCYSYYTMSGFKIANIIKRIHNLRGSIPDRYKQDYFEKDIMEGLMYFLKKTLSFYDQKYYDFIGNREEFYNSDIGNLVTGLMDLLEAQESSSISNLILNSVVLREFSTDRILKILKTLMSQSTVPEDKDALSLALMCIQRSQCEQAKTVLLTMSANRLDTLLLEFYDLLFANHNSNINMFTELSMILIEIYPKVLATVLSVLVTEKRLLSLSKVLKIFMDIMATGANRFKNSSYVLQVVLENYFNFYGNYLEANKFDYKRTEAMKILIRIYLTRLQQKNGKELSQNVVNETEILFHKSRANYLAQVPPFGPNFEQLFKSAEENSQNEISSEKDRMILLKLQCILSFKNLPEECLTEVRNFLSNQPTLFGALSLELLSNRNIREAIALVVHSAPKAIVQFSKERLNNKEDWKFMVSQLFEKINAAEDERQKFFMNQTLSEIFHHAVEKLNIEDLVDIIPRDYEEADRYFALAQNNAQANHLKNLIAITGKQLLASM